LEEPSAVNTTFEIRSTVPFSQPFTVDSQSEQQEREWSSFLKASKLDAKINGKQAMDQRQKESSRADDLVSRS